MGNDAFVSGWREILRNAAAQPLPSAIPQVFRNAATDHADRVLIRLFEDDQQITYGEFDTLSSRLAAGLRAAGIEPGMHVGVMLPNSLHWHITWLALLKIGAAVVPINPSYTARELQYVLDDARVGGLVLAPGLGDAAGQMAMWPTYLRRERVWRTSGRLGEPCSWQALLDGVDPAQSLPEANADVTLDTIANIQYTSGTTPFPKGCLLTHGYWLNLAQGAGLMHPEAGQGRAPIQRFFTAQPFFYMDPFWQLLMTALNGGTLFAAQKISASRFFGWLDEHRIEWAQLPELAMKSVESVAGRRLALREVFTFGWSAESRSAFERRFEVPAVESFGMTEIGLGLAMPRGYPSAVKPTSVGIAGLRREARIVDSEGRPVGAGVTGELQIRGEHLFKGYFNKAEATVEAFDGDWFRTGDVFVVDQDGFYRIVGRFKDMIRRSNENIAAREVEAVVRELPQVLDCAAVPVPDPVRNEEVKILVQLHPELVQVGKLPRDVLPVEVLISHCQSALAPFKVPRYVQFVDAFPRTSSNKILKHQLIQTARDSKAGVFDRVLGLWHTA